VRYRLRGQDESVLAHRDVILCGGTINSPQLLMLSGIGNPDELRRHGIAVRSALPGVGRNLQDHLTVGIEFRRAQPGPFVRGMRLDRVAPSLLRAYMFGSGFASDLPAGCHGFLKTSAALGVPDIQMIFRFAPYAGVAPYLPPFKRAFADTFSIRAAMLHPESRGTVSLASSDPFAPVRIDQNFLATENDWETLRRGFWLIRELGGQASLRTLADGEVASAAQVVSTSDLDLFIRRYASTSHHPVGTCKMGTDGDPDAVVDAELRVRGVDGLRVVDGSVMLDLTSGNTNAPIMMIAEKAADVIRQRTLKAMPVDTTVGGREAVPAL
jgi:choline dehydrogenase-like flavoprotein